MGRRITAKEWLIVIGIAVIVTVLVASAFEPLTEADRAEMLIDGTQGLPQDR